jgi:hypothetical protein
MFNSNHSEWWIAVKPGTEDLVGNSKFFFDRYSKFYNFYLGTYRILNGTPVGNNQVQGYDCVSAGTQAMPPSWTDVTDPNVAFDTEGRVYQTTLPFNAFWGKSTLHPDGAIDVSYSDDMGQHWVKGERRAGPGAVANASARQAGHVEDKQWIAVNDIAGNKYQDPVRQPLQRRRPDVRAVRRGGHSRRAARRRGTDELLHRRLAAGLQDSGTGAVPVGGNLPITKFS